MPPTNFLESVTDPSLHYFDIQKNGVLQAWANVCQTGVRNPRRIIEIIFLNK
jgi:hypothetical protein